MKRILERISGAVLLVFFLYPVSLTVPPVPSASAGGSKGGTAGPSRTDRIPVPKGMVLGKGSAPETRKFYCGEKIVAPGDGRTDVLAKCGEPAWRELREDGVTVVYLPDNTPVNFVTTEEWIYNFGSHQFLLFLRFQGDRLAVIETGAYGYDDRDFGRNCGDGRNISLGDSKLEVLVKCGEPMDGNGGTGKGGAAKGGDVWTYNFGPDRFLYILRFRHGRVYDIRTGEYGH